MLWKTIRWFPLIQMSRYCSHFHWPLVHSFRVCEFRRKLYPRKNNEIIIVVQITLSFIFELSQLIENTQRKTTLITASGFSSPRFPFGRDVNEADLNVALRLTEVEQAQPHVFELYDYKADNEDTQFIFPITLKLTELLLARLHDKVSLSHSPTFRLWSRGQVFAFSKHLLFVAWSFLHFFRD